MLDSLYPICMQPVSHLALLTGDCFFPMPVIIIIIFFSPAFWPDTHCHMQLVKRSPLVPRASASQR